MQAPDEASGVSQAGQDARVPDAPVAGWGLPAGVDGKPWHRSDRRREIGTRLDALRARLKELRERDLNGDTRWASSGERLEAAERHAVRAHAAIARVLASSAEAFGHAAEAHERAASTHERTAAAGIGDVIGHERQAALHWAAAAADRRRAERARSLLYATKRAWPAAVSDEPRGGVAR